MTNPLEAVWQARGVREPCEKCNGLGVKWYGSTSTWYGGIGGASMTRDVCDECWGIGDKHHHGTDIRKILADQKDEIAKRAADYFAGGCGANMKSFIPALEAIIEELQKLSRGRKERPRFFYDACSLLSKKLKDGVEQGKKANEEYEKARKPSGVSGQTT